VDLAVIDRRIEMHEQVAEARHPRQAVAERRVDESATAGSSQTATSMSRYWSAVRNEPCKTAKEASRCASRPRSSAAITVSCLGPERAIGKS
jgi:hypothetical protein